MPLLPLVEEGQLQTDEAKKLYSTIKEEQGVVPKWVKMMAHNEDILVTFYELFKVTMDDNPVNQKLKWKVALRVSELNQCKFCLGVATTKLVSLGIGEDTLKQLEETAEDEEKIALRYAAEVVEKPYSIEPAVIDDVKNTFNDAQVVEITAAISLFNYINGFNDALGILPDDEKKSEDMKPLPVDKATK